MIQKLGQLAVAMLLSQSLIATAQQVVSDPHEYVPGEIIVKLRTKPKSLASQAFVGKAVSEKGMTLKGEWSGLNMHHFALKAGDSVEQTVADLQADPDVEFAEPNYVVHMQSLGGEGPVLSDDQVRSSSDASASSYTTTTPPTAQTSSPIGLSSGWVGQTSGLTPPIVAVIDTGIDYTHNVFVQTGAVWSNAAEVNGVTGVDDDANGFVDDIRGWNFIANNNNPMDDDNHGTHVSGIILGVSQNITSNSLHPATIRIMPLKFLDATGSGSTSDAVKAIYYAVNNGAKVLSNSWGGGGYSNSLLEAIAYAYDHKVAFIAAAGNASSNNDSTPTYPANYAVPNMISVAAVTDSDAWASFSNYGPSTVHVGAPGNSIMSTVPNNGWQSESGTSMATPFVSGLAALMMRENPTMTGYQIKSLIFSGGSQISSLANRTTTKERMYIPNALNLAKSTTAAATQPSFDVSAYRAPASDSESTAVPACGLVKAIYDARNGDGGEPPFKNLAFFGVLLILVAPIFVALGLRNRPTGREKRRFERFEISSSVTMKIGDRELTGLVSSISQGGLQIDTDAWLQNGGVLTMSIASPDGKESIQVQGQVVWSEEQKRYGVAFSNAESSIKQAIARWTTGLTST